jgi:hypothetical protein
MEEEMSTILEIEAKLESLIKMLTDKKVISKPEFDEVYGDVEIEVMKRALKKLDSVKESGEVDIPAGNKEAIVTSLEKLKERMEEMRLKGEVEKLRKKHGSQ